MPCVYVQETSLCPPVTVRRPLSTPPFAWTSMISTLVHPTCTQLASRRSTYNQATGGVLIRIRIGGATIGGLWTMLPPCAYRVLDVGSGCGVLTAAMAMLVRVYCFLLPHAGVSSLVLSHMYTWGACVCMHAPHVHACMRLHPPPAHLYMPLTTCRRAPKVLQWVWMSSKWQSPCPPAMWNTCA